jgi:hypothetical protein
MILRVSIHSVSLENKDTNKHHYLAVVTFGTLEMEADKRLVRNGSRMNRSTATASACLDD